MKISAYGLLVACASLFAGCALHGDGTKLVWTQDGVYMEGSKQLASGEDHPVVQAARKVYEQCGGEVGDKRTRVSWRTESPYPIWTEAEGWHFVGVECADDRQQEG